MKRLFLLSLVVTTTQALASYELVLVADRGTNSIHRFDGSTGTYFGQFASGDFSNLSPAGIAVVPQTGKCYVADFGRSLIIEYEYSTGLRLRTFTNSGPRSLLALSNGDLLIAGSAGFRRYSTSGSTLGVVTTYTTTGSASIGMTSDGFVYSTDASTTPNLRRFTIGGSAAGVTALPATPTLFYWQATSFGTRGILADPELDGVRTFTSTNPPVVSGLIATPGLLETRCLAAGHGFTMYAAGRNAATPATGLLKSYFWPTNIGTPYFRRDIGSGILIDPFAVATVVAPEPEMLVPVAVGVLLTMRRRKK